MSEIKSKATTSFPQILHMILLNNVCIQLFLIIILLCIRIPVESQRLPVLDQIDLPHNYYFRELYLPQLTSGPSSVSWTPDGSSIVFSMAGSLWIRDLNDKTSYQLTDGPGYDYQPDCSPEGNRIVFTRYNGKSLELMILHLDSKEIVPLTQNGAVNLQPRWSPDTHSIAFVSSMNSGHFLLYISEIEVNKITSTRCITPDRISNTPRYYYSQFDHGINPCWSPDGTSLYFVSNREIAHGTGDIVSVQINEDAEWSTVHHEETNWMTHPDISPDGTRMVYSSYLGRNWHQLWLLPASGGYPMPLTYGEYDNTNPRWSPDGKKIAFISNRTGNTSLWIVDAFTGKQKDVSQDNLNRLNPVKKMQIIIRDENGNTTAARISITDSREKFYAPQDAWIHADDSYYPGFFKFENHYFHMEGSCTLDVPEDKIQVVVSSGPEYQLVKIQVDTRKMSEDTLEISLQKSGIPEAFGTWWSGDLHVHMNYSGKYRNFPNKLLEQASAEKLNFIYNLIVNKEQRIPDINYFSSNPDPVSTKDILIFHAQEFHTSFWGHLGLLNLENHFIIPDYSGYPETAAFSLYPHNVFVAENARQQNALVGYVHPFLASQLYPEQSTSLTNDLPLNAALGNVDYYELVGFADHLPSADVWYKLLNCGLRIPAGAGTDAMANYASLRGPVGLNRVYIKGEGQISPDKILDGLKSGRSFVTNGPLLGIEVEGFVPGEVIQMEGDKTTISYKAFLKSSVPVDCFDIIWNGEIAKRFEPDKKKLEMAIEGELEIEGPGWLLVRAWSDKAHPELLDIYPYASTNPIYFEHPGKKLMSKSAAEYFIVWMERLEKAASDTSLYRTPEERNIVLNDLKRAIKFYQNCAKNSTIP